MFIFIFCDKIVKNNGKFAFVFLEFPSNDTTEFEIEYLDSQIFKFFIYK